MSQISDVAVVMTKERFNVLYNRAKLVRLTALLDQASVSPFLLDGMTHVLVQFWEVDWQEGNGETPVNFIRQFVHDRANRCEFCRVSKEVDVYEYFNHRDKRRVLEVIRSIRFNISQAQRSFA